MLEFHLEKSSLEIVIPRNFYFGNRKRLHYSLLFSGLHIRSKANPNKMILAIGILKLTIWKNVMIIHPFHRRNSIYINYTIVLII